MDPITTEHELTPPIPQPISPESGHRRLSTTALPLPPEAEQPPCPRCDSTNTKFCYYNNYNLSQPRHFCKSCHRYWTRGGALRKVPVGGGTRKPASSNKRRRVGIPPAATLIVISTDNNNNNSNLVSCSTSENETTTAQSGYSDPVFSNPDTGSGSGCLNGVAVNLNDDAVGESGSLLGCWWNSTEQVDSGRMLLPFADGYGSGMGCGPEILEWPPVEQVVLGGGRDSIDAAVVSGESRSWQMGGGGGEGEGGGVAEVGDYFCWPDLAISTPAAKALK